MAPFVPSTPGTRSRNATRDRRVRDTGTRWRVTHRHQPVPRDGAPSRENANIIRDAAVSDAIPQKNCATTTMNSSTSARRVPRSLPDVLLDGERRPHRRLGHVRDRERDAEQQDAAEDHRDDDRPDHADRGAERDALCVSSLMCAEASYPV